MVYNIVAISGSLQKASTNTGLLRACIEAKNPNLSIQILDISDFPHLNSDLIENGKFPKSVEFARQKVTKADAVLFAIPQYNYRVSAPLKNAYDWLSIATDPAKKPSPLKEKVAGMISSGLNGGNQAQEHFIQICGYCKVNLMKSPLVQIKRFQPGNFNQKGDLTSEQAKIEISKYLKEFSKFIEKNK